MRIYRTQGRGSKRTAAVLQMLEHRSGSALTHVQSVVHRIIRDVRLKGDSAVVSYAQKLDSLERGQSISVTPEEMSAAWQQIDSDLRMALQVAAKNIRNFARRQLPKSWTASGRSLSAGLTTGQLVRSLDSVGCYVPGGRHPLPSTMLMTVIPAQVAGVGRIVVTSPNPAVETLATAHLLGIQELYRIGGAHAVAALAYGTSSIGRVTKVVGPGNSYVTAAKRAIAFDCAIDMLAGPTEIVITSDRGHAGGIASDLVAQAEHDPEALAIFVTTQEKLAQSVLEEVKLRASFNPTARQALRSNGYIFVTGTREEAQNITNCIAPEHLSVDSIEDLGWVRNAGSVFIGEYSPQPMGDYISGPNHTLPTGGMAHVRGGLSVMDFVKLLTVQQYTRAGLQALGPHAIRLAEAEGLTGHAEAIKTRLNRIDKTGRVKAKGSPKKPRPGKRVTQ